jgi:FAD/FMN-containing dehydrogenase
MPELNVNQEFHAIMLFLGLISFCILLIYFLTLKQQRKQIYFSLKILQKGGMQVFIEKYERLLYSRDVGDLPKLLRFLFNFNCIAVIQPKNVAELQSIISLCEQFNIPLIPRGAGTSGLGGVLPIKNGIIVNLMYFDQIIAVDTVENTVEVECGVTWEHLRKFLESKKLALQSYPSSAPSSMIGGWVTQGGYGVGSAKFGSVKQSVVNITILGTEGKEFKLDDPEIFIGSCGALGILWKVTLRISSLSNMIHVAVTSIKQNQLLKAFSAYQNLVPFFLRYEDYQNLLRKDSNGNKSSWDSGGAISMSFQEENWDQRKFDEITRDYNLSNLSSDLSEELWNDRFYTIRLKREGPSLIIAEVLIPTIHLEKAIGILSKRFERQSHAIEIVSTSDNLSVVFIWFPADLRHRSIPIIGPLGYTARRWKGRPYSSGLWLSPYSRLIFGNQLIQMKQLKKKIDPNKIFNPGKVWGTRIPRFLPIIPWKIPIRLSVPIVNILYSILPKKFR